MFMSLYKCQACELMAAVCQEAASAMITQHVFHAYMYAHQQLSVASACSTRRACSAHIIVETLLFVAAAGICFSRTVG